MRIFSKTVAIMQYKGYASYHLFLKDILFMTIIIVT